MIPIQPLTFSFDLRVGDIVVTPLTDGYLDPDFKFLRDISDENIDLLLKLGHRDGPPRASVNAYAIRSGGRRFLIDTGSGDTMGPTCGRLFESLASAGIDPADVEAIMLTHVHPDHSNGLIDLQTNARLFPNAEILLHEKELSHWFDDAEMSVADERARRRYFEMGRRQLTPYIEAGRVRTFTDGEILPSIVAVPCHGHTPGHTAYQIGSGPGAVLAWGDTVHVQEVQLPFPDVTVLFDWTPEDAAASRRIIIEKVIAEGLVVAGAHLHFPGFGHIARNGDGYSLVQRPELLDMGGGAPR
ncbi:MBL fold metallo-hydrolase [Sphingomonas sp. C8-2]|nr:MBL fold metallo-hydrolase [Sphingomonas sp. C8-2]